MDRSTCSIERSRAAIAALEVSRLAHGLERHLERSQLLEGLVVQLAGPAGAFVLRCANRQPQAVSVTDWAVAMAMAALDAKDASRCSSLSKEGSSRRLSSAISTPCPRPRNPSGTTRAKLASGAMSSSPCPMRLSSSTTSSPVPVVSAVTAKELSGTSAPSTASSISPAAADTRSVWASWSRMSARLDIARPRLAMSSSTRSRSVSNPTARAMAGGLEATDGALELVAPELDSLIQACVVDGDRGPVGKHHHQLLVALAELAAADLLGQVQVAVGLAADRDRHAEKGRHRGMAGREPVRPRMRGHVGQAQRPRVADQLAQHPATARKRSDPAARLLVQAGVEEALEPVLAFVEDAEGGIASVRQLGRGLKHVVEDRLEIELGDQRSAHRQQPA